MRSAALTLLALLLGLLGANEWFAEAQRSRADAGPVHADVEAAQAELGLRLLALESSCARIADDALRVAAGDTEPVALFDALERLRLPQGAGVHVYDRHGRMLAWAGSNASDAALR